jgi:hypothetical protein
MKKSAYLFSALAVLAMTACNPKDSNVTGVEINKDALSLFVGGTETLTALVSPSDADRKDVTWSSNATGVATVDTEGLVTAVAPGTATITATTVSGGKTDDCTVTVTYGPGTTPPTKLISHVLIYNGEEDEDNFEDSFFFYYDEQNLLSEAVLFGGDYKFSRTAGTVTVEMSDNSPYAQREVITLNDGGYAATSQLGIFTDQQSGEWEWIDGDSSTFEYQNDRLSKIILNGEAYFLTWDAVGNVTKLTDGSDEETYEYTTLPNHFNLDISQLLGIGILPTITTGGLLDITGERNNNLISKLAYDDHTNEYRYEFDEEGLLVKATITDENGVIVTYIFTYI